jgi:uncharacterized iron-regulated protein
MVDVLYQRPILIFVFIAGLFLICGCAGTRISPHPMATVPGVSHHFWIGQIVALDRGEAVSFEELIKQIAAKDLIFVGEVHDNPEHHLIQVQILQALTHCGTPLAAGMEFFQVPHQTVLDLYLKTDTTEEAFLEGVDWTGNWGYDYLFYRPLLLLAKGKGIEVLAINATKEIVRKIAREGLDSLSPEERGQLPEDIDLTNEAHRAYVREAYEQEAHHGLENFEYFYEAQCVWEETMALNLATHLSQKNGKLVVFVGNGHIVKKFGIPYRTIRRVPVSMVTIMPYPLESKTAIEKETADYIWLTPKYPRRQRMSLADTFERHQPIR